MNTWLKSIAILGVALGAFACASDTGTVTGPGDTTTDDPMVDDTTTDDTTTDDTNNTGEDPTFTNVYAKLTSCTGCHNGGETVGLLDLTSQDAAYSELTAESPSQECNLGDGIDTARVALNDAANSFVVRVLEGNCSEIGGTMANVTLPADSLNLLKAWINAGAPND